MKLKMLIPAAIATAAFALPLAVQAQGGPGPRGPVDDRRLPSETYPTDAWTAMDKNGDDRVSRAEWDAHFRSQGSASGGGTVDRTPASEPMGTTAGPGMVSPRTGTGGATATQPSTSGHGRAK